MKGIKNLLIKKMPSAFTLLFILVLGGAIVGLSGTIKAEKERLTEEKIAAVAKERVPANVVLLDIAPTTIQDRINLPGVIEPWERLTVLSRISGTVINVEVNEVDNVTKGQVIARIDPDDFRIAVDSARASYVGLGKLQSFCLAF
jgi:multidrug efflux pump subunit AcrA (membrane-fusion protein)